jgi:class 3 adenylate cyclase
MESRDRASDGKRMQGTILFADIANSALVSDFLSIQDYAGVIQDFRCCAEESLSEVARKHGVSPNEVEKGFAGDEFHFFLVTEERDLFDSPRAMEIALDMAFRLKLKWLFGKTNCERMDSDKAPLDLGIGIHVGPIVVTCEKNTGSPQCEGYTINLAKRVESGSRAGNYSGIFVSQNALRFAKPDLGIETHEVSGLDMKGISAPPRVFEIIGFAFLRECPFVMEIIGSLHLSAEAVRRCENAMRLRRQFLWYGLLTVGILVARGSIVEAIHAAEGVVNREPHLSLYRFLGLAYDVVGDERVRCFQRAVLFNERALQLAPYDIMAQFNLAVTLSHTSDSKVSPWGQSKELCTRVVGAYTRAQGLLDARGPLRRKDEFEWKLPLFKAHALKNLARGSVWERTGVQEVNLNGPLPQEVFWLNEAIALYHAADGVLRRDPNLHERWLTECLCYRGETHQLLGQRGDAVACHREVVALLHESTNQDVACFLELSRTQLQALGA